MPGPTATQVLEAQEAMMGAARKLSTMPELEAKLMCFINYWGVLDAYQPDEETMTTVTHIVHGMLAAANCLRET